ncbi:Svop [Symbiodinium sp. CCMP2456]|nr:Svop [Symbiodinium sp. CCMP2456]
MHRCACCDRTHCTVCMQRIFAEMAGDWTSPAMEMLIISGAEFVGIILAGLLLLHPTLGRIRTLQLLCVGSALCSAALTSADYGAFYVADPAAYALKAVVSIMFTFLLLYISEALPVSVRASGVGLCMGVGRLGSIAAPAVYGIGYQLHNSVLPFLLSLVLLSLLGSVASSFLVVETRGRPLDNGSPASVELAAVSR